MAPPSDLTPPVGRANPSLHLRRAVAGFVAALAPLVCLAVLPQSLRAQTQLGIAPAVEVFWPSQPNRLYQILSSDSLIAPVWADAGAPVLGTGAEVRSVLLRGDATHRFYRVAELPGTVTNWLAGLTELDLRPARLTAQAGGLLAEGARVIAVGLSSDDLVTIQFQFDDASQSLRVLQYQVVSAMGVFNERFFAKDVPLDPLGSSTGVSIPAYTWWPLTGTNIVVDLRLEVGQVLNYGLVQQTEEYSVEVLDPDRRRLASFNGAPNLEIVAEGIPILRSGAYQMRIRPRALSPGTVMSCQFFFANSNSKSLAPATDGSRLTATLRQNTHDYAKYSLALAHGQTARLPAPPSGIGFKILNSRSQTVADVKGLPLIFDVPATDTYYLFVYRIAPGTGNLNYSAAISIRS